MEELEDLEGEEERKAQIVVNTNEIIDVNINQE